MQFFIKGDKMKLKHLMIVSLILTILTIGAVSASDDIVGNDTLSQVSTDDADVDEIVQESSDDVVSQEIDEDDEALSYSDDEPVAQADDESVIQVNAEPEDLLGDYVSGGVEISIDSYVDISDKYSSLGHVYDENGLKGTITLKIDGKKVFTKKYTSKNSEYCYIYVEDVGVEKLKYGYHTVKLTYDNGKAKTDSRKVNFVSIPTIDYPSSISVGEKNGVSIEGDKLNGTATIYYREITGYDSYNDPIYKKGKAFTTVNIVNGKAWIPLGKLTEGNQALQLEYKFGTWEDVKTFTVVVKKNSKEFKSSLSKTTITYGKSITAKLTGPKADGYAEILLDNSYFKDVRFNFGKLEESISGLKVGKHRITIQYSDSDSNLFYSTTYKVTVKHAINLKLKKVKVKKSAKKLVIKATLKIDGKKAKHKKVIFKFKNKKYTAKTNKKGVAKITIKKKILKKLKKGKKVKYQVTYGEKTVKKSVKVKK